MNGGEHSLQPLAEKVAKCAQGGFARLPDHIRIGDQNSILFGPKVLPWGRNWHPHSIPADQHDQPFKEGRRIRSVEVFELTLDFEDFVFSEKLHA